MTNEREPLWSNQRIRDRYHALVPSEADMGEMEYWNVLRDVGERVSYELRDEYEGTINVLISDNNRMFDRAAERLAEIYELRARIAELDQQLVTAQEHIAAQESIYQVALDSIEELEAQLSQTWQPLPDGEVFDTITRSLVSSESINDTYTWMRRVDAATKWINVLRGKE